MLSLRRSMVRDSSDREVLQKVYTPFVSLEEEYIKLELLSMDLRVNENRQKYVLFGPDAMDNEVFDGTTLSRAGLIAPSVFKDYLLSLAVAGFATVSARKYRWRNIVLLICILTLTYESYEWLFSDSFNIELYSSSPSENYLTRPEQIALVRHVVLLITLLAVFIIDLPVGDSAILRSLKTAAENVEVSASKLQASRLARMATMGDDTLRKHAWDFYRKAANEKQHIFNDPEYKKIHADLARKYNLENLTQKADEAVNGTFNIMFDNMQGK
ncbi:hypothetical protein PSACC_01560 [Paramicrosporidium saccamoebae]|uniref:Uncharacterized protein n=1 Tax=Paramicrosporidium saccamoebae TaxID=1246581 RepID=A0A2H9TLM9_9FUNG|nr:hypothetical protein PSACC_01560 [Paramicrosporidium saccamoebae]